MSPVRVEIEGDPNDFVVVKDNEIRYFDNVTVQGRNAHLYRESEGGLRVREFAGRDERELEEKGFTDSMEHTLLVYRRGLIAGESVTLYGKVYRGISR
jgi:hypothetical protein